MNDGKQHRASANAKVLLFGEHAVVHGRPAIALALPDRVVASARASAQDRLRVPAWSVDVLRSDAHPVARAFDAVLDQLGLHGVDVEVDARVPPGAGLGSSAALAVAVARAALRCCGQEPDSARVSDAAMAAERVFHGNPSGLDHAAAMNGGLIRFERGTPPRIAPLVCGAPLTFVVAHVAPGASTRAQVEHFAERVLLAGAAGPALLDAFGAIAVQAIEAIAAGAVRQLGVLMDANHGLLAGLGMSTRELDAACRTALEAGALGAKLTGAGGGGCIVALVEDAAADTICSALRTFDAQSFILRQPSTLAATTPETE